MNRTIIVVVIGIACGAAGWFGGSMHAEISSTHDQIGWSWLDSAAIIANADGTPKSADAIKDSVNGNFVAKTRALAASYEGISDHALRERVKHSAQKLAGKGAVQDVPLALGGAEVANAIISCIAKETTEAAASQCAQKANRSASTGESVTAPK